MADVIVAAADPVLSVFYHLYLPNGVVWTFTDLRPGSPPISKQGGAWSFSNGLIIPLDLITAARLRFIKPGDDSGLTDEQWAWIKLIGLTGEGV